MFWRREKSHVGIRNLTPDQPVHCLVTKMTMLPSSPL